MLPTASRAIHSSTASTLTRSGGGARDLQPVLTFGKAAASCHRQAKVYGACILAQYESVERGMCEKEFAEFRTCVQTKLGKKW